MSPKKSFLKSIAKLYPLYQGDSAEKRWEIPLKTKDFMDLSMVNPDGKPRKPLLMGEEVLYSDGEDKLVAVGGKDGKVKWQYPIKTDRLYDPFMLDEQTVDCSNVFGAPSSDGKGTVFYRPDPETLTAVKNGKVAWTKNTGFTPQLVPPATDAFGGVYVLSKEHGKTTILALDGATGNLKFKLNCSGDADSPPVVSQDGRILIKMKYGDSRFLCCYESPFNPEISASIPEGNASGIEQGEGWVSIGGIRLEVKGG